MSNETAVKKVDFRNCVWLEKEVCKIPEKDECPSDCSLKGLEFDKDKILKRVNEEGEALKKMKEDGVYKNRYEMADKVAGVFILEGVLKKHFNASVSHIVDTDLEKSPMFKGLRLKKVK
jgi:hypothetical protein